MFVCTECGSAAPAQGQCPADHTPLQPIGEDLLLGTMIGAYRVARLLGIGGMGRVYKGVHPTIGSRVAIKVLSRECSDRRDLVERFFSEARAVNLIRHESIVNILDLAMLPDGRPYIIMEYLDGAPLANIVEASVAHRAPLPLGGLARLCAEVLDALGAAHAKGVVHRDLKPDNIFVAPSGRPKVLDFGIAKLTDLKGSATATGSLLGTPHYMAPEQAAGRPVDHRADIYAMGVILFECATGHKPFVADSLFELLRKHVEVPPPAPRTLRPELAAGIEHVILCALAKAPEQRFATTHAMSIALQHATQGLPADQWTPITGGPDFASTHPRTPWVPTPPQSWSEPPRSVARPSVQPPNAPVPHPTTVSASSGQLHPAPQAKRMPGARKGIAIALIAAALAIGGIVVGVTSSSSREPPPATIATTTPAPAPTTPAPTVPAPAAPPSPSPPRPAPPTPPEVAIARPVTKIATDVERRVTEAAGKLEQAAQKLAAPVVVEDPDPTPPTPPSPAASGWFTRHDVTPPSTNWKKLDVGKHIDWAIAEAKRNVPDAQLTRIDVPNVFAAGHADLTIPDGAHDATIDLRFISPSRAKRDPSVPRGIAQKRQCEFRILVGPSSSEIYDLSGDCKTAVVPRPRCSLAQVWKKAIAKQPELASAVASLTYTSNIVSKRIVWMFSIEDDGDRLMSEQFPDDC